jgi:hypothetical protein
MPAARILCSVIGLAPEPPDSAIGSPSPGAYGGWRRADRHNRGSGGVRRLGRLPCSPELWMCICSLPHGQWAFKAIGALIDRAQRVRRELTPRPVRQVPWVLVEQYDLVRGHERHGPSVHQGTARRAAVWGSRCTLGRRTKTPRFGEHQGAQQDRLDRPDCGCWRC